jgi:hypothetical protein
MAEQEPVTDRKPTVTESETSRSGFDLFAAETTQRERRRYWLHFGIYVVLLATTVWPIFTLFNRIEPYVLGMPFNMFWDTLVLVFVTVNTYLLYRFDEGPLLMGG